MTTRTAPATAHGATMPPVRAGGPIGPGLAVAAMVLLLTVGALGAVAARMDGLPVLATADLAAIRFTLWQAAVSAVVSVVLAVPVARALARRRFAGRGAMVTLLGAPFLLPSLVAVLGLLAVVGRGGLVNDALGWLGLDRVSIYGPQGVVLAHVFFNLPLAVRLILHGWLAIPAERFRLAAALGLPPSAILRRIELPMLREVVPGALLVIFLICLTSFAVALILGGGPRATTVELAIYQAFLFDFDLGRAAMLAAVQFAMCAGATALAWRVSLPGAMGGGLDRVVERWDAAHTALRVQDTAVLTLAALFLLVPLAMVVAQGLPHVASLPAQVWAAAARSVGVALSAALLTGAAGLALTLTILRLEMRGRRGMGGLLEGIGLSALAASPLVIGTGLFLIAQPVVRPADVALPVTVAVNAAMALPFAIRALLPALRAAEVTQGRLADALGLRGVARLRHAVLPRLRRPLGFSLGLAAALSMGDLGVIVLFADANNATLPMQMQRLMGAYRMDDAAGAAVLLLALSLGLFWVFDRGGRGNVAA